ncbi:isoaspartyl dipeptidase [Trichoderma arundinaceum]|uniref:Isoaspartyl dipeptidase n=1 Tax=Trichoderma arundinaceum TaxID=490622 RepID=A0A395NUE4_TRIAR|nr:isoaspartyl dipeptidase [Trichoderma arundinaceum]
MAVEKSANTVSWPAYSLDNPEANLEKRYQGPPRNVKPIQEFKVKPELLPPKYEIDGTEPASKILFINVNIIESTGRESYKGSVYIQGERITHVGEERTMLPGFWLYNVGFRLYAYATSADAIVTRCFGAAAAKDRLDVAVRDAINAGSIPGPRSLANAREIVKPDGDLNGDISSLASSVDDFRRIIKTLADLGVDNVKLSMSGEAITETRSAEDCYYTEEETRIATEEAHKYGKRVCSHARARDSVIQCAKHDVDVIYHASFTCDEGMKLLEEKKDHIIVAPAINFLWATLYDAEAFGYSYSAAESIGYKRETEIAVAALREMHRRGIIILPGGDYGFGWCPHGTYARDLMHFHKLLDMTTHESIIAATAGMGALMGRPHELGKIQPGYYADLILVDGNPIEDIEILQNHDKLNIIMINGRVHKASRNEFIRDAVL